MTKVGIVSVGGMSPMGHYQTHVLEKGKDRAGYGKKRLEQMASTGRAAVWHVPKLTVVGDTVLFYIEEPVSAIVAVGKALSGAKASKLKWYQGKVEKVRLLDAPIALAEMREMFPNWAWLRSVNMFAYVTPERAKALLKRCELRSSAIKIGPARSAGGGFGDAETNALVEKAAIKTVTRLLKRRGFKVRSREREWIGYDLNGTKGRAELHVEVKGVSGEGMQFLIKQAEVARAASDSSFRLMVVTEALTRSACVREFLGANLMRHFALTPVGYLATRK